MTYPGDADTRFDREYYIRNHLPLVMKAWGPYGLETTAAFFPTGDGAGTIAIAVCVFRDDAAMKAGLGSPQTAGVMADVKKFTNAQPAQSVGVPPQRP